MSAPCATALPGSLLYDADALRAIERAALADASDSTLLMQRAGRAGWQVLATHWPQAARKWWSGMMASIPARRHRPTA